MIEFLTNNWWLILLIYIGCMAAIHFTRPKTYLEQVTRDYYKKHPEEDI